MKNKKGKISGGMILLLVLVAVAVIGVGYLAVKQNTNGGNPNNPTTCGDSTGVLTLTGVNAYNSNEKEGATITCGVNSGAVTKSVTSGTTSFGIGEKIKCLLSQTGSIDTEWEGQMVCGGLTETVPMYNSTSTNPTITIKDPNNQGATLSNAIAGGTVNLTAVTAGATVKFDVDFQGVSQESSGDGVYVIELPANSNTNITSGDAGVTFGSATHANVPSFYVINGASARVDAFNVPAIKGADDPTYKYVASLKASKDVTGGVYTTWYAKQSFIDSDGTIKVGVEDSLGTTKYENTGTYNFYIGV